MTLQKTRRDGLTRRPLDQDRPKTLSSRTRALICEERERVCLVEFTGERHRYEVRLSWETVEQLAAMIAAHGEQLPDDEAGDDDETTEERPGRAEALLPGFESWHGDADPKEEDQVDVREEEISQLRELADKLREDEGDEKQAQALGKALAEDFIAGLRADRETMLGPLEAVAQSEQGEIVPIDDLEPDELTEKELERQRRRDEALAGLNSWEGDDANDDPQAPATTEETFVWTPDEIRRFGEDLGAFVGESSPQVDDAPASQQEGELLDNFTAAADETLPPAAKRRRKRKAGRRTPDEEKAEGEEVDRLLEQEDAKTKPVGTVERLLNEADAEQQADGGDVLRATKTTVLAPLGDDELAEGIAFEEGSS